MKLSRILVLAVVLCFGFAAQAVARTYTYTDLGSITSDIDQDTIPYAINNNGQIVGRSNDNAFVWENGQMQALIGGGRNYNAAAYDINDQGQIVGVDGGGRAVIWQNGVKQLIGLRGPTGTYSNGSIRPMSINNNGLVVYSDSSNQSMFWQSGVPVSWPDWNPAMNGARPVISGLNDNGMLSGNTNNFAFTQTGNAITILTPSVFSSTVTHAINADGTVVGKARNPETGNVEAVIWNGSTPQFLGEIDRGLGFSEQSVALGINAEGMVVGKNGQEPNIFGPGPAFLYDPATGEMIDLNSLEIAGAVGMYLVGAIDINDKGQIIGVAKQGDGWKLHGFLLTPTPIPGAVWLLGTGLLGLIGFRKRKAH